MAEVSKRAWTGYRRLSHRRHDCIKLAIALLRYPNTACTVPGDIISEAQALLERLNRLGQRFSGHYMLPCRQVSLLTTISSERDIHCGSAKSPNRRVLRHRDEQYLLGLLASSVAPTGSAVLVTNSVKQFLV